MADSGEDMEGNLRNMEDVMAKWKMKMNWKNVKAMHGCDQRRRFMQCFCEG